MGLLNWLSRRRSVEAAPKVSRRARPLLGLRGRQYLVEEPYFLPKDDQEINRLDFQHFLFRLALKGNYAAPVTNPTSILDVGTGTGRWAMELAELFPQASVIGLDVIPPPADKTDLAEPGRDRRPNNYLYVQGNVLDGLPFPDGTFDFVHQRLLVAAIPEMRWPGVVGELFRVTRPGGWVELLEAIPARGGPAMNTLYEWLIGVGIPRGVNILVTPQIGTHLRMAGAARVVARDLKMPLGKWGGRAGTMMETNYIALHKAIQGRLVADGTTTPAEFDAVIQAAQREIAQGQYIWPYFLAYGQRPIA